MLKGSNFVQPDLLDVQSVFDIQSNLFSTFCKLKFQVSTFPAGRFQASHFLIQVVQTCWLQGLYDRCSISVDYYSESNVLRFIIAHSPSVICVYQELHTTEKTKLITQLGDAKNLIEQLEQDKVRETPQKGSAMLCVCHGTVCEPA